MLGFVVLLVLGVGVVWLKCRRSGGATGGERNGGGGWEALGRLALSKDLGLMPLSE
jgi:hypothetical protein